MDLLNLLQNSAPVLIASVALLGALIGSFLNVVIFRLPGKMRYEWQQQCQELLEDRTPLASFPAPPGLIHPPSHCPSCGQAIRPWHNIPILSYLLLRGRCADCQQHISLRYPSIEFLAAISAGLSAWILGWGPELTAALILGWALIVLAFIDYDHQLLPDQITLPLLWLGLISNFQWQVYSTPAQALYGACIGYLSLWSIYQVFKLLTGKEGMGYGDFKLLAMLGAWLGWQRLPILILLAAVVGTLISLILMAAKRQERDTPIPFGPFLAAAGWITLLFGDAITNSYLQLLRLY